MTCSVSLFDIKAAEAHVQDSGHERRMIHDFKPGPSVDRKYKCPPCGIAFRCSIALELHLVMTHKVTFSTENLPEVTEVIKLLSGSSSDVSISNRSPECSLCQEKFEGMDDFVMHLFSNAHVKSLRMSTCIVCEKTFIHVNDRESHLHAYKHKCVVQKSCLNNKLRKVQDSENAENTGYLCMYCMVWCQSWPCFMLHLLGNAHRLYAEKQDQLKMNQIAHTELQATKGETFEDISCPSISRRNWNRWLDQSVGLSAWCRLCEEVVLSPEATEKHLESHHELQSRHREKRYHPLDPSSEAGKPCDLFECEVCCVVFKNVFALAVHKALPQHHIQQARVLNVSISCRCSDCRMRCKSTTLEKTMTKLNSTSFGVRGSEQNVGNVQTQLTKEYMSEIKKDSYNKSSETGEFQGKRGNSCEQMAPSSSSELGKSAVEIARKSFETREITGSASQVSLEPGNKSLKLSSDSTFKEENISFEVEPDKGKMSSGMLDTSCFKNSGSHASIPAYEALAAGERPGGGASLGATEQHLRESFVQGQNKNGLDCDELVQSSILTGTKEMVPVVIAAALPPSDSIQNSLQSAMKLVTESLSAVLPKIRKHTTEVFSGRKRSKCDNFDASADKPEGRNLGTILETAVCRGLQSLHSHSSLQEAPILGGNSDSNLKHDHNTSSIECGMASSSGLPPMSISTENIQGITVVFAAAVIPQTSSIESPTVTCKKSENQLPFSKDFHENPHEKAMMERTCFSQQKIDETDGMQDQDMANLFKKESQQDLSQHLNIVYEDDSSSDSDQERAYPSTDDFESSDREY
eukprot:Gb_20742 [translate_table: standard]